MINGNVYRSMIVSAANNIANLQDEINKLVPENDFYIITGQFC